MTVKGHFKPNVVTFITHVDISQPTVDISQPNVGISK